MKISVESVLNKNYKLHHAYVQCVYIVSAKYQIAQSKAVVGVERPIKALSMHIQNAPLKAVVGVDRQIFFFQPDSLVHMFNVSILYRKSIKLLP